jgi:phosphoribosylaminoimidazole-succinocarboxamide synthase
MAGSVEYGAKLAEGKTKIIWEIEGSDDVLIESKDDITAGDGERRDYIPGKAALATETTANCFRLLKAAGIPTHFVDQVSETTFRAKGVDMIPIELVARRLAFGSYLKRNPDAVAQSRFEQPEIEFFDKDDGLHDPLLLMDRVHGEIQRHVASQPVGKGFIDAVALADADRLKPSRWDDLSVLTAETFSVLEAAWANQDVTLVDTKIECGQTQAGRLLVADVIDNDSWRIWPGGDPAQMADKQLYRDGRSLDYVADRYAWVAEATKAFVLSTPE